LKPAGGSGSYLEVEGVLGTGFAVSTEEDTSLAERRVVKCPHRPCCLVTYANTATHLQGLGFKVLPSLNQRNIALAARACLLVLLCCAHPTKFLTRHLPYPVNPTVVPSVRHTTSTLPCL
jgi:hypothetical protein